MIDACKYCEHSLGVEDIRRAIDYEFWSCPECKCYSFNCLSSGIIEMETVKFGNFYFIFMCQYEEASVVSVDDQGKQKRVKSVFMKELTHELAIQWVAKLKTYTTFQ